jgi:hypothetical protein
MEKAMIEVITAIRAMNSKLASWPDAWVDWLKMILAAVHSHGDCRLSNHARRMERLQNAVGCAARRRLADAAAPWSSDENRLQSGDPA